jgi:hypothetical protein
MISVFLSLLFFLLAAACNACMDKLSFHFHKSIFNNLNPKFWDPSISWKYAKIIPLTKYKIDAWHLFKSGMVIFLCLSIVFAFKGGVHVYVDHTSIVNKLVVFTIMGLLWNGGFNLFFNTILSRNV